MSVWLRVVAIGGVAIVAFDTLAAVASKLAGFPYGYATVGSWLIYFGVGYFAAKASSSVRRAALAAGIVGAVEATLGWGVSWLIGPGQPPGSSDQVPVALTLGVTIIIVIATASAIGAIGGLLGKRRLAGGEAAP